VLDADKRLRDAATFADELAALTDRHPVGGRRAVSRLVGQLVRSARGTGLVDRARRALGGGGDDGSVVWMLDDSYAHVHREPWNFLVAVAA
jgi:hypothetical protein